MKQEWKFLKDNSSNPHSTLVKQVVFLSMSLSSLPVNEKIKIEAWRDEEASPLSMEEPGLTCWMLLFKSPLLFFYVYAPYRQYPEKGVTTGHYTNLSDGCY